ncbi:MAG: flagellar basal body-associated FliL family protein [Acidobacteria bacterium]|nr:flagellar basal body-associated FliL family protein [Acidobacteriota bacterium]
MSETDNNNAAEEAVEGGAPRRNFKKLIIIAVVLLLVGGGGFYYWRSRSAAATEATEETDAKPTKAATEKKSKAKKPVDDSEEEEEDSPPKKSGTLKSALPKDGDVKKVIELPPFIVNLADTDNARYLRMTVSLGVGGDDGSEKPDQLFMTRVRNAMLAVLSEKTSDEILTAEGKAKLRKELLKAAQAASDEPEVQAIYITDFIVQL